MKHIAILGSTGSIGLNALEVIRRFPYKFKVIALSADSNVRVLYGQIKEFRPKFAAVRNPKAAEWLCKRISPKVKLYIEDSGVSELVQEERIDQVLLAISGAAALNPLLKAIEAEKEIALANKEALVMAGQIIMKKAAARRAKIIPVDSEQSAIWQCLQGEDQRAVDNVYLTASGGPLFKTYIKELKNITIAQVLKHPRWKMGKKITVDSATLMNKGFEVLEAMFLFNLPCEKIRVLIHPEAVIHSMVEFRDGVVMAQLSATDMRIPIQYSFSYPLRLQSHLPRIDFCKLKWLNFYKPDFKKFPCLKLAYRAARQLGTYPCVLNAANEVCVEEFLKRRLSFISIPSVIERVMDRHKAGSGLALEEIFASDRWSRNEALRIINTLN